MKDKENKAGSVRGEKAEDVIRIVDPEGRVPTPEELARAICMATDKKAGVVRRENQMDK